MDAINPGSIIIQVINFAIVIFIMKKFLFDPYLKIIIQVEEEQQEIDRIYAIIDKIKKDAETGASQILAEATRMATEIREGALENAQKHADKMLVDAQAHADIVLKKAEYEIESLNNEFKKRMKEGVMSAAVSLNKKLLGQSNTARQDFMKAHLEDVCK